eukprot:jgi/Bigna1/138526/aug1.45_g13234
MGACAPSEGAISIEKVDVTTSSKHPTLASSNTFKAMCGNDLPHLKRLIGGKANVEERGPLGDALSIAGSREGNFEIVKCLVDVKANVEAKNRNGHTSCDLTNHDELKVFIKQNCIERRVQVFKRDLRDLHTLSTELKRGLGAAVVAMTTKNQTHKS